MSVSGDNSIPQATAEASRFDPEPLRQERLPTVVPPQTIPAVGQPNSKLRWWLWAAGGLLGAGLAALMYVQPWAASIAEVTVETVVSGPVTRVLAVNGRIAGVRSVDVRPLVSGTLVEVSVVEGDAVIRDAL